MLTLDPDVTLFQGLSNGGWSTSSKMDTTQAPQHAADIELEATAAVLAPESRWKKTVTASLLV
jgi:hypothetical protein